MSLVTLIGSYSPSPSSVQFSKVLETFPAYYAEFQHYAAEVAWDEVSSLAALKRGLAYGIG